MMHDSKIDFSVIAEYIAHQTALNQGLKIMAQEGSCKPRCYYNR